MYFISVNGYAYWYKKLLDYLSDKSNPSVDQHATTKDLL